MARPRWPWPDPRPQDWPKDRHKRRVIFHGEPDHADRYFYDILFWSGPRRVHHCAFAELPTGPDVEFAAGAPCLKSS